MSPALIQLFVFMTITFALGLFLGWAIWRYGGVSKAALDDLESKAEFWKKSLDQSRIELWELQEKHGLARSDDHQDRLSSRRMAATRPASDMFATNPLEVAQG